MTSSSSSMRAAVALVLAASAAISPDGRSIATVNMRETAFATDSPRYTPDTSIIISFRRGARL